MRRQLLASKSPGQGHNASRAAQGIVDCLVGCGLSSVRVDRRDEGPAPFVPLVIELEFLVMRDITSDTPLEVLRRRCGLID